MLDIELSNIPIFSVDGERLLSLYGLTVIEGLVT